MSVPTAENLLLIFSESTSTTLFSSKRPTGLCDLQDAIQREWTGDIYFNNGTANSCGVAILFNPRFNYTHTNTSQDSSGRVLAITIKIDDHYLQLVNLYAPNSDTDRRKFFSSFFSSRYHIVIGEDFNSIVNPTLDKQGGNLHPDNTLSVLYTPSLLNLI